EALRLFAEQCGIPVAETMAGKGAMLYDHPLALGAMGVTGTPGANIMAREADLIIGIGTRYSDFTSASKTAFQNPNVRFISINVAEFDAFKHNALPLTADARVTLEDLTKALKGFDTGSEYRGRAAKFNKEWDAEVSRIYGLEHGIPVSQGEVIGAVNTASGAEDVVLCAAGSLPGDLHKLWRTRNPKGYHLEYGYSCMGYEIAGGLGAKMADPSREVYVMVGDGSYLMMSQEIVTAIQEKIKLIIILINNHGFASIGGLSNAVGSSGFGTHYKFRDEKTGQLNGDRIPVDFAMNARSLGARVIEASDLPSFTSALVEAKKENRTTVIMIETDREQRVGGYESWWDVAVAEVSEIESVKQARSAYEEAVKKERYFL
ncbi:MAG: 3D-(3,5/4)-trihydroxycyclohexane-1,2-dione acylhydrolase (decyclizing), partial [Chloroflexi bacterium]|nr:3D-(3,5/4)-trihydroxycyclohexane-1,2-dione acylhydrolase (decyclizing) [Chloroflexota bacterium]